MEIIKKFGKIIGVLSTASVVLIFIGILIFVLFFHTDKIEQAFLDQAKKYGVSLSTTGPMWKIALKMGDRVLQAQAEVSFDRANSQVHVTDGRVEMGEMTISDLTLTGTLSWEGLHVREAQFSFAGGHVDVGRALYHFNTKTLGIDRVSYSHEQFSQLMSSVTSEGVAGENLKLYLYDVSQRFDENLMPVISSLRGEGKVLVTNCVWSGLPLESTVDGVAQELNLHIPDVPTAKHALITCDGVFALKGEDVNFSVFSIPDHRGLLRGKGVVNRVTLQTDLEAEYDVYQPKHFVFPFQITGGLMSPELSLKKDEVKIPATPQPTSKKKKRSHLEKKATETLKKMMRP